MKTSKKISLFVSMVAIVSSFAVTAFGAVEDTGFSDVSANAWYAEAVEYCVDNGLMSGMGNNIFDPEGTMTRAMFTSVLYRHAGSPTVTETPDFMDVEQGMWYSGSIAWAAENGVLSGYGSNVFGTNDPVTREQVASILWRYMDEPASRGIIGYADASEVSSWAEDAVVWAQENNIMNTRSGNTFAPKANATRAELAFVLMNCFFTDGSENSAFEKENEKILIAYFSRVGNTDYPNDVDATASASIVVNGNEMLGTTERIARMIQEETGGELYSIHTAEKYPVDFDEVVSQNHSEQAGGIMPALSGTQPDMDDYDAIFIGYPVWSSTAPMPIISFISQYDLTGKTIIPFCTHDGYGSGSSFRDIASEVEGAVMLDGLAVEAVHVPSAQETVVSWVNGLNI